MTAPTSLGAIKRSVRGWAKSDHHGLARYVDPRAASQCFDLGDLPLGDIASSVDRSRLLDALYTKLADAQIGYTHEPWNPDERYQEIRSPQEVLQKPGHGTCLDLAALFAALSLEVGLLPVLVVTEHHASVMVSLNHGRDDYDKRQRKERSLFTDGKTVDGDALRHLVANGQYAAVETTGFAVAATLPPDSRIGAGREQGQQSFTQAMRSGQAHLNDAADPLRFALDIALTHSSGIAPRQVFPEGRVLADDLMLAATQHGVRADRLTDSIKPIRAPRPSAPPPLPSRGVIGRKRERGVLSVLDAQGLVGVAGSHGSGRSEMLRWMAHSADANFADGSVHVRYETGGALDVLQEIFERVYFPEPNIQLTTKSASEHLSGLRLRVLLDDFDIGPDFDVELLRSALASSGIATTSLGTELLAHGPITNLDPFTADESVELFERCTGPRTADELLPLRETFSAAPPLPKGLVVIGNAVAAGAMSLGEATAAFRAAAAANPALQPREEQIASILQTAFPAYVPRERLAEMVGTDAPADSADLDRELAALNAQNLIRTGSPRYQWTGDNAVGLLDLDDGPRLVDNVMTWLRVDPEPDHIVRDRALVLRAIEIASAARDDQAVFELAKRSELALMAGNRWDAWHEVLSAAENAAVSLGPTDQAWAAHQLGTRSLGLGEEHAARAQLSEAVQIRKQLGETDAADLSRHNLNLLQPPPPSESDPDPDPEQPDSPVRPEPPEPPAPQRVPTPATESSSLLSKLLLGLVAVGLVAIGAVVFLTRDGGKSVTSTAAGASSSADEADGGDDSGDDGSADAGGGTVDCDDAGNDESDACATPTPTVTTTPIPTSEAATPTPAVATPTSVPITAVPITVSLTCRVSSTSVLVGERFNMFATVEPAGAQVTIEFNHGDGTIERAVDNQQDAFFSEPGTYRVSASWASGDQTGTASCGTVAAKRPPDVTVRCWVSSERVEVDQVFTIFADVDPDDAVVDFNFDHGDGTLAPVVNNQQDAKYLDPGTYEVRASWLNHGETQTTSCGTVTARDVREQPVTVTCSVPRSQNGGSSVLVGETFRIEIAVDPAGASVEVVYDHGDGYAGPSADARFLQPGTYEVSVSWISLGERETAGCGIVTARPVETETPDIVRVTCSVSATSIPVNEPLTISVAIAPEGAPLEVVFNHGDGYVGPSAGAVYAKSGSYDVSVEWTSGGQDGTAPCGTVEVSRAVPVR